MSVSSWSYLRLNVVDDVMQFMIQGGEIPARGDGSGGKSIYGPTFAGILRHLNPFRDIMF